MCIILNTLREIHDNVNSSMGVLDKITESDLNIFEQWNESAEEASTIWSLKYFVYGEISDKQQQKAQNMLNNLLQYNQQWHDITENNIPNQDFNLINHCITFYDEIGKKLASTDTNPTRQKNVSKIVKQMPAIKKLLQWIIQEVE